MKPMDDVALRYLLLALRLGRHHPGLVDSYSGPPEIAEAVAGEEPIPPAELHGEALQLADAVAEDGGPTRRSSAGALPGSPTSSSR